MEYSTVDIVSYSPTGTSRKIASGIAGELRGCFSPACVGNTYDFTRNAPDGNLFFRNSLVVVSAPVYGGRVAETAVRRLKMMKAESSDAVAVVLYGNRDYEDALVELTDILTGCGFRVIGAAAFIGEHSYSRKNMPVAEGRPDDSDMEKASGFGKRLYNRIISGTGFDIAGIRGNRPYKVKGTPTPQAPVCNQNVCVKCGYCAGICPVGAITVGRKGAEADSTLCTKCCACVKGCPAGALVFDTPYTEMLFRNFSTRKEPEFFL